MQPLCPGKNRSPPVLPFFRRPSARFHLLPRRPFARFHLLPRRPFARFPLLPRRPSARFHLLPPEALCKRREEQRKPAENTWIRIFGIGRAGFALRGRNRPRDAPDNTPGANKKECRTAGFTLPMVLFFGSICSAYSPAPF